MAPARPLALHHEREHDQLGRSESRSARRIQGIPGPRWRRRRSLLAPTLRGQVGRIRRRARPGFETGKVALASGPAANGAASPPRARLERDVAVSASAGRNSGPWSNTSGSSHPGSPIPPQSIPSPAQRWFRAGASDRGVGLVTGSDPFPTGTGKDGGAAWPWAPARVSTPVDGSAPEPHRSTNQHTPTYLYSPPPTTHHIPLYNPLSPRLQPTKTPAGSRTVATASGWSRVGAVEGR